MNDAVAYVITAILGGGLFKGLDALYRAVTDSREKRSLAATIGAKTPTEIESVSVTTMTSVLSSAETRIKSLEKERRDDYDHYQARIAVLELEKETDRQYYQGRIVELTEQLHQVREAMESMETKLADLLAETQHRDDES